MMAMPGDDEYDHGPVSPLGSFYEPQLVKALGPYLISEEPPMWVIDSPDIGDGAGMNQDAAANGWIQDFIEFVEAQAAEDGEWEPFNVKHALSTPPERFWIDGSSPNLLATEKLNGFKHFLAQASGCEATFLDEGLQFALKRYPSSGAELGVAPEEMINGEFVATENLHIDRLQRDPDKQDAAQRDFDPALKGRPTHFTLVVNFDDEAGGTHFPHGRLLPGLAKPPPGVTPATAAGCDTGSGILVRGRRGRALLWSNHRGANAAGVVKPLLSSLHQSLLKASRCGDAGPRRVCIFGWAENGRKWERCGFHECLEYESPKVRADFFGRTVLEELQGWAGGPRAGEVAEHLRSDDAQAEIKDGLKKGKLNDATREWLARFGICDTSKVYQLELHQIDASNLKDFVFNTLSGNRAFSFQCEESSIELEELRTQVIRAYGCRDGQSVAAIDVFRGADKFEQGVVAPAEQKFTVALRLMKAPKKQPPEVMEMPPSPSSSSGFAHGSSGPVTRTKSSSSVTGTLRLSGLLRTFSGLGRRQ